MTNSLFIAGTWWKSKLRTDRQLHCNAAREDDEGVTHLISCEQEANISCSSNEAWLHPAAHGFSLAWRTGFWGRAAEAVGLRVLEEVVRLMGWVGPPKYLVIPPIIYTTSNPGEELQGERLRLSQFSIIWPERTAQTMWGAAVQDVSGSLAQMQWGYSLSVCP